ncbi:MAG: glycosyltransferase family 39 protein [Chloroflexaceae bacterium]|nr:glycosyltransferase family 39 protein [Chloroflexaceae bacterium]
MSHNRNYHHHHRIIPTLLLFGLALGPRVLAGHLVTVDEAYHWFERVERFLAYVQQGDYAHTNLIGHPGVTTMWLGSLGLLAHQKLADLGWLAHANADSALYRAFLRGPVALANALSVVGAWVLLRRLLNPRVALVAALLWATEPFLVAHSQLLHLDGLLTSLVLLALLAAIAAFPLPEWSSEPGSGQRQPIPLRLRWGMLAGSAVAGGLSFLTKSPSVILLPMVGLIAAVGVFRMAAEPQAQEEPQQERRSRVRVLTQVAGRLGWVLLVWGGIAAAVWVALWPAAWVDLPGAVRRVVLQVTYEGASPHGWGNFFLGQAVDDPGPLFYPVVLALRMTPWTMAGLAAAGAAGLVEAWRSRQGDQQQRRETRVPRLSPLALLALYALLFLAMMSLPPKKFDRYVLPVFPALTIIAASGLVRLAGLVGSGTSRLLRPPLMVATAAVGLGGHLLWYHPYELAYYNPLLGGGATAVEALPVGWGEGYEQAGVFISAQPNGCERPTATWFAPVLYRFLCNHWVVPLDAVFEPGTVDYAVLYIDQIQRDNKPHATAMLRTTLEPLHTVWIHGIPYAEVYQLPLPNAHRVDADFGPAIRLRGYDLATSAVRTSGVMTLTLQWEPQGPGTIAEDYQMLVHVLDASGSRVGQIDVPPGGPRAPTSTWLPNSYITWIHPVPVPPDLPAGSYYVAVGLYRPDDFARLPVRGSPQPGSPNDGPNVLMLDPVTIR